MPFDGSHQSCLFTADEGASPHLDAHIEFKAKPHAVIAKEAFFVTGIDGSLQAFNCQWIFSAAINVAETTANGICGDHHPFNNTIRVALKYGAVHKGPRVPFVGIANEILKITRSGSAEGPLHASRETTASTSPKAGLLDFLDDLLGLHGNSTLDPLESAVLKKRIETFRVDGPAAGENNAHLFLKKFLVVGSSRSLFRRSPANNMLFHDLRNHFRLHEVVGDCRHTRNLDVNQYVVSTQPTATGSEDITGFANLALNSLLLELRLEGIGNRLGSRGKTTRPLADQYFDFFRFCGHYLSPPLKWLSRLGIYSSALYLAMTSSIFCTVMDP